MTTQEQMNQSVMGTYGRFPVVIDHGAGESCADETGKTYIDFGSGIGTTSLGYCNEAWTEAVCKQVKTMQHTSNLYYTKVQADFAQKLCQTTGYEKVFFCNSGAEANECAIKLARKYSFDKYGKGRHKILTLVNSFHGRTLCTLSATGQDVFHNYFFPFVEGFDYVALGHLHSPQKVGRDTVRYAGSPLKYSFSEAHQHKAALFVTLGEKGSVRFEAAPLTPRHDLRELRGSYMELTDRRNYDGTAVDDYLHITLTDEQDVPDALARLRVIYPNLMRLDYDNLRTREDQEITAPERAESITPLEHFSAFYQLQNNQPLTAEQAAFCQQLIEEIWKEGEDA